MAKDGNKSNSTIAAMKAAQRQLQRADEAGLFDGMKAWANAWHETEAPADDPPPERTAPPKPTAKPPRWATDQKLGRQKRAELMMVDRKLFPNGVADISVAVLDDALAKECKKHHLKTWKRDTTARAKAIVLKFK
ncbi:hypothetical protein IVA95_16160 [Bradyrhizobium sp. 157]|uniref:hypothetical protein n=1 Tax=Bradyrhizobium sp. 157 TaxID=2782631 RepID=UPI001FF79F6A|nr:hypothetical protein [Bradyrhizobium sp. 157]MCK1639095.1 hypothetical protein [Bradyrhizobium sp. 157]